MILLASFCCQCRHTLLTPVVFAARAPARSIVGARRPYLGRVGGYWVVGARTIPVWALFRLLIGLARIGAPCWRGPWILGGGGRQWAMGNGRRTIMGAGKADDKHVKISVAKWRDTSGGLAGAGAHTRNCELCAGRAQLGGRPLCCVGRVQWRPTGGRRHTPFVCAASPLAAGQQIRAGVPLAPVGPASTRFVSRAAGQRQPECRRADTKWPRAQNYLAANCRRSANDHSRRTRVTILNEYLHTIQAAYLIDRQRSRFMEEYTSCR